MMAYKTFTVSDFGGGLNTAVAESRLDTKFSPSLENVDFTETGAITRRNGYISVTGSVAFSGQIDALYRFYQADGDKQWLAVCGTHLYSRAYVTTEVAATRLEAEAATWTTATTG